VGGRVMTTVDFFCSLEKVTLLDVFVSNNNTIIASFGKKRERSTGKYSDLEQKMFDTFLQIALPCSLQNSSFYMEYIYFTCRKPPSDQNTLYWTMARVLGGSITGMHAVIMNTV
jgi:hypothetical protein